MNLKDKKHAKMMNDFFEIFFDGKRDKIVNNIRDKEQQIFLYIMMHNEAVRRGTMCRELIVEIGNHFIEQFDVNIFRVLERNKHKSESLKKVMSGIGEGFISLFDDGKVDLEKLKGGRDEEKKY